MNRLTRTRKKWNNKKGLTVAELILLLAVIFVFALIMVPIVLSKLEEANQIADVAQARSVYGVVTSEVEMTATDDSTPYYYDGARMTTVRPATGYGKSSEPFESFAPKDFPVKVTGIPKCGGEPMYLMIKFKSGSIDKMIWGGYPVITTKNSYIKMSQKARIAADKDLMNSLQLAVRHMTYGKLKDLLWDDGHDTYKKNCYPEKGFDGGMSFSLALSNIDTASGDILAPMIKSGTYEGHKRNEILNRKLFEQIGYNTELKESSQYLILSHDYNMSRDKQDPLVIKVNVPEDPAKADEADFVEDAVVYVDGNGVDPEKNGVFGYDIRKDATK